MLLCVFMESFTDLYMDVYGLFPLQLTMIWLCICKCTDLYMSYIMEYMGYNGIFALKSIVSMVHIVNCTCRLMNYRYTILHSFDFISISGVVVIGL